MSLFENENYRWRETYFVLLRHENRPTVEQVKELLRNLGPQYQLDEIRGDDDGHFDYLTLLSPDDYSALDISYVTGDEVAEHIVELRKELSETALTKEERAKLLRLTQCDARYDVYHFEQVVEGSEEDDEFIDPGSLLVILEKLARLCHGVGVDPQSGSLQ